MFITRILQFYKHRMKVPGKLFAGKHRIYPRIYPVHKSRALKRILQEEENMQILNKPYLSIEQEQTEDMVAKKALEFKEMVEARQRKNMLPHRLAESQLNYLLIAKRWE